MSSSAWCAPPLETHTQRACVSVTQTQPESPQGEQCAPHTTPLCSLITNTAKLAHSCWKPKREHARASDPFPCLYFRKTMSSHLLHATAKCSYQNEICSRQLSVYIDRTSHCAFLFSWSILIVPKRVLWCDLSKLGGPPGITEKGPCCCVNGMMFTQR